MRIKPTIILVPSMNHAEISSQIKRKYEKICSNTLLRFEQKRDTERRKLKIKKDSFYLKGLR
jgi:hypothetical protein